MCKTTFLNILLILLIIGFSHPLIYGQVVPILNYSTNTNGQVQLEVASSTQKYYILKVRHHLNSGFELATSMTLGAIGTTIITEPLGHYPIGHYQILEYSITAPYDTDGDNINDNTEYTNFPSQNPINAANSISVNAGVIAIDSLTTFNQLSISKDTVQWSEFLNGKRFAKFIIVNFDTAPEIYFINGNTYDLHTNFANAIGIDPIGNHVKKGQIIYHPTSISSNGTLGTFAFNYSNGHGQDFDVVQKSHELLAANMPFLTNNLSYFVTANSQDEYEQDSLLYESSRVPLLFEADVYAEIDYWGLNEAEGFGFFRQMPLGEIPDLKDIVLYNSLPNALPRVGGVITSVIQTPLSHVNLRAIQDKIPNAFIRDPLSIDSIADLLNHYIYFKVEQDRFTIREATLDEVNSWFEDIRPDQEQLSPLNLDYTSILHLEEISFSMFDGFGAKCANIATMRTFGFPEGTIPNGFGIPFYFYQEFMKYNNFFDEIRTIMEDPDFISDRNIRSDMLTVFRKKIKDASLPNWMLSELATMHAAFPANSSVRCRSSTNNEDLPGFNGAGLYTSKTQHPDEGHIAKSIKQVYASLWNLRAFDEREFYRVNHFTASMGILCHPNYSNEKANGVGVTTDPVYQTDNTFYYLNSQVGEELITNPNTTSIPEEVLLDIISTNTNDYIIIRHSNLVSNDSSIMDGYLNQMRDYLTVIHDEFAILYDAVDNKTFAMEIEYKITSDSQLLIKQARPWVAYVPFDDSIVMDSTNLNFKIFPNPAHEYISIEWVNYNISTIRLTSSIGENILEKSLYLTNDTKAELFIKDLPAGIYILTSFSEDKNTYSSKKFVKR
jgi:hypothetical protein